MKDSYTKAVLKALTEGKDTSEVLSGLSRTLIRRGHTRLHGGVLRAVLRTLESKSASRDAHITVASESALLAQKDAIAHALSTLGATSHSTHIDPTIIGGVVAEYQNVIIDTSFKTRLTKLYRAIAQ